MRKFDDIRKYINREIMVKDKLKSEARVIQQVMDYQLLKGELKVYGELDPTIYADIDISIDGFMFLYIHGGTHDKLPAIIDEQAWAREYYEKFAASWSRVQNYMATHMSILDL